MVDSEYSQFIYQIMLVDFKEDTTVCVGVEDGIYTLRGALSCLRILCLVRTIDFLSSPNIS